MKKIVAVALLALCLPTLALADVILWTEEGYRMAATNSQQQMMVLEAVLEEEDGLIANAGVAFLLLEARAGEREPDLTDVQWRAVANGDGMDTIERVIAASDGWLAAGSTSSTNWDGWHEGWYDGKERMTDAWLTRFYETGALVWAKTFGGDDWDSFHAVCPAHDGGWIAVGNTYSSDGDVEGWHDSGEMFRQPDGWIVHIDDAGELVWQRALGGSGYDELLGVARVPGGYLAVGTTDSEDGDAPDGLGDRDGWIALLDTDGRLLRQRRLGGRGEDGFTFLAEGPRGLLAVGTSWSFDDGEDREASGWAVCLNDNGETLWTVRFGLKGADRPQYAAAQDGGWVVAGTSHDGADAVQWTIAIDGNGKQCELLHRMELAY